MTHPKHPFYLRNLDQKEQLIQATPHTPHFEREGWPEWLDEAAVKMVHDTILSPHHLASKLDQDTHSLKDLDLTAIETVLEKATWRTGPNSPDTHAFYEAIVAFLSSAVVIDKRPNQPAFQTPFPFSPDPSLPLEDFNWVWLSDSRDSAPDARPLWVWFAHIHKAFLGHILLNELALAKISFSPNLIFSLLRHATRGGWFSTFLEPLPTLNFLLKRYPSQYGYRPLINTTDVLLRQIDILPGKKKITIQEEERLHTFSFTNFEKEWDHVALRGAIAAAFSQGGSLILERPRHIQTQDAQVKDVYAAYLGQHQWGWLTAQECRLVHTQNFKTGETLDSGPGKIYRGFHEDVLT